MKVQTCHCKVLFTIAVFTVVNSSLCPAASVYVTMETSLGSIGIELYPDKAPITVNNFLQYADADYYDGLLIHRVVNTPSFAIVQGGGYELDGGLPVLRTQGLRPPIINESYNGLSNLRGTIAMARMSDPASARSQFYFNVIDHPFLDHSAQNPGYCVFGRVVSGMNIVDQIALLPTLSLPNGMNDVPYYNNNWVYINNVTPEPCTLLLLTLGGIALGRKHRNHK
jgi:peptidyl-prolyl cis-trans isomerase A (cyclophilin A)